MITTNFSLRRGRRRGRRRKKILCDPDRLHKSALFKWANIIWSPALWSIIPDSYPSREGGINHGTKLFSSASPPLNLLSLYITRLIPLALCHARFVLWFSLLVLLNAEQCFCCNHFKRLCASISVIGFRSSLEWESGKPETGSCLGVNAYVCVYV